MMVCKTGSQKQSVEIAVDYFLDESVYVRRAASPKRARDSSGQADGLPVDLATKMRMDFASDSMTEDGHCGAWRMRE